MMSFTINGKSFDGGRTHTPVETGTVEESTLKNPSHMGHPLHLRVWPLQGIEDGLGSIPSRDGGTSSTSRFPGA